MSRVEDTEALLDDLVRLRKVQAQLGESDDLRAVRASLERRIGPTVKPALAGRMLGVSQPGLSRWVESGDVPRVPTASGRWEVPTAALAKLVGLVREAQGAGERFPLAAVLQERRRAADRLDLRAVVHGLRRERDGHRSADIRSLAYHRAVAQRLDEEMVEEARLRMAIWMDAGKVDPRYAEQWAELLERPLTQIARAISRDDQRGRDLRQNSPFAGALSEPERRRVLAAVS